MDELLTSELQTGDMQNVKTELNMLDLELDALAKAILNAKLRPMDVEVAPVPVIPTEIGLDEESLAAIRDMQESIKRMEKKMEVLDDLQVRLDSIEEMTEQVNYIKHFLDTKLNLDFEAMYHNMLEQMNVESIKTYRNLQAVVVEEQAKQNAVLFGVDGKSDKLKRRMNHIIFFSIVSFITSILVMLMILLPALGFNIF